MDFEALTRWIGELDEAETLKSLQKFVAEGPSPAEAQQALFACQSGMAIVGDKYEEGEYFVGDLIFAGELLTAAMEILKPALGADSGERIGTMVLGTVEGDLHDIGKNIFLGMSEAAGFTVHDVGIGREPEVFVQKVREVQPQIVGLSGVLTVALESMKKTVEALEKAGLRDSVKIIIGGNSVTQEACGHIGADACTTNAAEGVKICQEWVR